VNGETKIAKCQHQQQIVCSYDSRHAAALFFNCFMDYLLTVIVSPCKYEFKMTSYGVNLYRM